MDLIKKEDFNITEEQIKVIKEQLAPKASSIEFLTFIETSKRLKLDPLARQIYLIGRWDSRKKKEIFMPMVSIDGARTIADRSGVYAGQDAPLYCDESGEWKELWTSSKPPVAAKVTVHRANGSVTAVALFKDYLPPEKQRFMWNKMPCVMIAKCAEMLALRKAFPNNLSGVYVKEEMEQAGFVETTGSEVVGKAIPLEEVVDSTRDKYESHIVNTSPSPAAEPKREIKSAKDVSFSIGNYENNSPKKVEKVRPSRDTDFLIKEAFKSSGITRDELASIISQLYNTTYGNLSEIQKIDLLSILEEK